MRHLLATCLLLLTTSLTHAGTNTDGPWLDVPDDFFTSINCNDPLVEKNGRQFTCTENDEAYTVLAGYAGERLGPDKAMEIVVNFYDATDLYVLPPEETMRYESFAMPLYQPGTGSQDQEPTLVGYAIYSRYMNELLGAHLEITARYNLKGDLIKAQTKEL